MNTDSTNTVPGPSLLSHVSAGVGAGAQDKCLHRPGCPSRDEDSASPVLPKEATLCETDGFGSCSSGFSRAGRPNAIPGDLAEIFSKSLLDKNAVHLVPESKEGFSV